MATFPNWEEAPRVWDTLELGGKRWPGVWSAEVEGGPDVDIKKSDGANGATITLKGHPPKDVTLHGKIMASQWERFQEVLPDIEPALGKKDLDPLDIIHPDVNVRKVTSIAVLKINTVRSGGLYIISVKAIEFNKPKPSSNPADYDLSTVRGRQKALADLGYYTDTVDGKWGPNSRQALKDFQKDKDLLVDGIWGPQSEKAIRLALGLPPASPKRASATKTPAKATEGKEEYQTIPLIMPDPLENRRPSADPDP